MVDGDKQLNLMCSVMKRGGKEAQKIQGSLFT